MTLFSNGTEEANAPDLRAGAPPAPGTVTVVIPTFNESGNIRELLARLADSLPGRLPDCEVVFVDDSTDDTPTVAETAGHDCPFPVTVIHRDTPVGGLGGAVVEGLRAAHSEWIVVMDADLQHPPSLVPELVETGTHKSADLVVASRYTGGGSRAGLAGAYRVAVSRGATCLAKGLFPRALGGISDPMSGFFAIRRDAVRNHRVSGALRPLGYKILLELAVRSRPSVVAEVPFVFQDRYAGESKSTVREGMRFLAHLVRLRTASPVARALVFGLIGLTGFVPNLAALAVLTSAGMHYVPAEIVANQFGVLWNFLLIELLLFRERRRHRHWADRLGRFGLLANADLVLRIPLITLFVGRLGMGVFTATAFALVVTFVLRFAGTEMLVYLPRRGCRPPGKDRGVLMPRSTRGPFAAATAFLLAAMAAPFLLLSAPETAQAGTNLIINPGFETAGTGDMPACWEKSGWGDNDFTFTTTANAHSGSKATTVTLTRRVDGDHKTMMTETPDCAPHVTTGQQYDLSVWYKSTTADTAVTLFRHDTTAGWQYWTDLMNPPVSAAWNKAEVRTPPVPAGTDQLTWGVSVYGVGSVTTDDYTTELVGGTPPDPVCTGTAAECQDGKWDVLSAQNPVRSMHSVVLKNGKVLLIAGSGNNTDNFAAGNFTSAVYDPEAGTYKVIPTPDDMFCSGHIQLSDGRVLVLSGNKAYPAADDSHGYEGYRHSYVFDPDTETYTQTNDLNDGHWYPSATEMGNGDVMSFGGLREDSTGSVTAEKWSVAQNNWLPLSQVNQTWSYWGLYPSMILMQDGRLFYSGSHVFGNGTPGTGSAVYDYDANTVTPINGLQNKDQRDQSASVLLPPAQDQRVLTIGGGNIESNPDANRLTDLIDLKQPNPAYFAGPLLPQGAVDLPTGTVPETGAQGKMYVSAVLLPDGKVLETGGGLHNRADPVHEASIFAPQTETFDPVAADPQARGYHSSAFLLPDGRVMATGDNPGNGTWNHNVSIYTPAYLFKGPRPQITSVAGSHWTYGSTQRITVDRTIARAELIRPAAVTHSSDPNQRFIDLPMTVNGTTIDLNVTSNPNLAPPGWYMLFAVDANGVPSVAKWVHLYAQASATALRSTTSAGADTPSPHIHGFARDLANKPQKPGKRRTSAPAGVRVSGCDNHYGTPDLCVPAVFPNTVKATAAARCTWLSRHDFQLPLKVNGPTDPLRLDPNHNGVACDHTDGMSPR